MHTLWKSRIYKHVNYVTRILPGSISGTTIEEFSMEKTALPDMQPNFVIHYFYSRTHRGELMPGCTRDPVDEHSYVGKATLVAHKCEFCDKPFKESGCFKCHV